MRGTHARNTLTLRAYPTHAGQFVGVNLTKYIDALSRAGLPEASFVLGVACITFLTPMPAQAGQIPVSVFNSLRVGMSEAQVLARAGPPDVATGIGADIYETETLIVDPQDESSVLGAARYETVYQVKELHTTYQDRANTTHILPW